MEFTKNVSSVDEQIALLQCRGLIISNRQEACVMLSNISYYRLSGYMQFFQKRGVQHEFNPGTSLERIYDLYKFDRELKFIIFEAIERLEIAIKNQFTLHLATSFGNNWYENAALFKDKSFFAFVQLGFYS